jgi:hypothetical protein
MGFFLKVSLVVYFDRHDVWPPQNAARSFDLFYFFSTLCPGGPRLSLLPPFVDNAPHFRCFGLCLVLRCFRVRQAISFMG